MCTHVLRVEHGLAIAILMAACGGDDDGPSTCEELAAIVGDCGDISEEEFRTNVCDFLVLSSECIEAAGAADCAEHMADIPSYNDVCFPGCGADSTECLEDDTIRVCQMGSELVFRCGAVCEALELTYNGTCSDMFEGMTSEDGQDVCWCQ